MMSSTVDFYFDFGSPAAYLAFTQLPALAVATGAGIVMKPMLLGGVFQSTGNRPPISVPLKGAYLFQDLERYARRYGVAFNLNPHFPVNTVTLMRVDISLAMQGDERLGQYREAAFRAMWIDQQNMGDAAGIAALLDAAGFDAAATLAGASEQAVKDQLKACTQAAVDRGVFGAPTFFVGEQMFWGQDRLDFVRDALTA